MKAVRRIPLSAAVPALTFAVLAFAALTASPAGAQAAFKYPTKCKVTADGNNDTGAYLISPLLLDQDFSSESLAASFPISSSSSLNIFQLEENFAELFRQGLGDGCNTDAGTSIAGQTTYSLQGSTTTLSAQLNTLSIQSASITRNNPAGSGQPLTAGNSYEIPQAEQLLIDIPFVVNAAGRITVTTFDFFRQDSGPTTGFMVGAYQILDDVNGNCQIDPGEPFIEGGAGIVFPNTTFSEPPRTFGIAAGNYILVLSYFNDIDLSVFSQDFTQSPSAGGNLADGMTLRLDIQ